MLPRKGLESRVSRAQSSLSFLSRDVSCSIRPIFRYFSTTIWEFTMKCDSCPQKFIIATDPKNRDYRFVSGCRPMRKHVRGRRDEENTTKDKEPLPRTNPKESRLHVDRLTRFKRSRTKDDFASNSKLRAQFRARRKSKDILKDIYERKRKRRRVVEKRAQKKILKRLVTRSIKRRNREQ